LLFVHTIQQTNSRNGVSHTADVSILKNVVQSMLKLFYLTKLDATTSLVRLNYAANMEAVDYM